MWINEELSKGSVSESMHFGIVTDITNGMLTINSHSKIANVKMICPSPVSYMPQIGQEVLVASLKSGEYLCLGQPKELSDFLSGEVLITSNSGGFIRFAENGDIIINGLTITKSGAIINPPAV